MPAYLSGLYPLWRGEEEEEEEEKEPSPAITGCLGGGGGGGATAAGETAGVDATEEATLPLLMGWFTARVSA